MAWATDDAGYVAVVSLRGEYHDAMTLYTGAIPGDDIVYGLFESYVVEDSADGMLLQHRFHRGDQSDEVVVALRDSTIIRAVDPAAAQKIVPEWSGYSTESGELWVDSYAANDPKQEPTLQYLLACDTGAAYVTVVDGRVATDSTLDWLFTASVDWTE